MKDLLIKNLDKMYNDIVQDYVHDNNIDDDISDILETINNLQNKIKWTL